MPTVIPAALPPANRRPTRFQCPAPTGLWPARCSDIFQLWLNHYPGLRSWLAADRPPARPAPILGRRRAIHLMPAPDLNSIRRAAATAPKPPTAHRPPQLTTPVRRIDAETAPAGSRGPRIAQSFDRLRLETTLAIWTTSGTNSNRFLGWLASNVEQGLRLLCLPRLRACWTHVIPPTQQTTR